MEKNNTNLDLDESINNKIGLPLSRPRYVDLDMNWRKDCDLKIVFN